MLSVMRIALFCGPALLLPTATVSAEIAVAESIEWVAIDSDRIVLGKLTQVQSVRDQNGEPSEIATISVSRTLKGNHNAQVSVLLRNYNGPIAKDWMDDGHPMLFFLVTEQRGLEKEPTLPPGFDWVLRNDGNRHCAILLGPTNRQWTHTIPCLTHRFDVLTDPAEIVRYVSGIRRVAQKGEARSETIDVPIDSPVFEALYHRSAVWLIVPAEGEAEIPWAISDYLPAVYLGIRGWRRAVVLSALLGVAAVILLLGRHSIRRFTSWRRGRATENVEAGAAGES